MVATKNNELFTDVRLLVYFALTMVFACIVGDYVYYHASITTLIWIALVGAGVTTCLTPLIYYYRYQLSSDNDDK